jgi:uncharacterized repeat protein (TIGR03803 family)
VSSNLLRAGVSFIGLSLCVAAAAGQLPTITQLFAFPYDSLTGLLPDGYEPSGPLVQASDGNFYGTNSLGGDDHHGCVNGCFGTVFKLTPAGQLSVLYTFTGSSGTFPLFGLIEGRDGYLYGTTNQGGNGGGTIFRIGKSGGFTLLHNFCATAGCPDGSAPLVLVQGRDGNIYGGTQGGGVNGTGVVFQMTPTGAYTVLHAMDASGSEGCSTEGVTQASDGNLYGVNGYCGAGGGTIFRLTTSGALTVIHTFAGSPGDGSNPWAPPTEATDGNLYGTTVGGGANGQGTVYGISFAGEYHILYSFSGIDGSQVWAPVVQASDGNLWGATLLGGMGNSGTVFALSTSGVLIQNLQLDYFAYGCCSYGLLQGSGGKIYVAGSGGGTYGEGDVFTVDAGLAAPKPQIARFVPKAGAVGSPVLIGGSHFIGTVRVLFNGVSTLYRADNAGYITAIVPAGASSGHITVATPAGHSVSAGVFQVQ